MRKWTTAALALLLALSVTACGGKTPPAAVAPPAESAAASNARVIHYGISNAWDALMPYSSPSGSNYARLVYDKIYDRLAYVNADGTLAPRGATAWEAADDGYAIIFHLDARAAFHDGTPVRAAHWADTIRLMTDPACPTLGRAAFNVLAGTTDEGTQRAGETLGAVAVDETTLKLTFKAPTTPEDFLLDKNREYYVLPTHLLAETAPADIMQLELWSKPIGSGPCRFVSELAGSQLTLAANAAYQLGAPGFDQLVMTVMDKSSLLTALLAGDLDYYAIGGNLSAEDAKLAEGAGLAVQKGTVPVTFYELMLNNATIPAPEVRRAIELALDKELLCAQNTAGLGKITDSAVLPGTPQSPYATAAAQPRSLENAKTLLEAGQYDGRTFKLACAANRAGLAALMQQNLEEAGIHIAIETVDSATLFSGMADGDYDMAIASHTPNALPLWFVESRFTENNNIFHVADLTEYTTAIAAIKQERDPEARKRLVLTLDQYLLLQRPFIPLWFSTALHAQSPTVTGIDYAAASFSNENVWAWQK